MFPSNPSKTKNVSRSECGSSIQRSKGHCIEESKDLSSLALDELIGNLKVHEVFMEKDSEIYKGKKERVKYIALKAKKDSSYDETLTSESDDKEYVMAIRNFKKFFRRKGRFVRQPREEKSHYVKGMIRMARVIGNALDAVIRIISLANVQNLHRTRNKKHLVGVLGVIVKMKPKTKPTKKLVSWLNRQMKSPSSKVGLGFDKNKASTSITKQISFVGSAAVLVDMDQDSAHMVAASKVPMLKPGEYEIWRMRIEQYIEMKDYALGGSP
ncbi:hypothetical protein Tco_1421125 [Tanacetum coccineum]